MGGDVATCAEVAAHAERRGFSSAWTAEFYDRSATVSLAAMAAATSRITLGSAVMYAFGRTPVVTVAEARDLDEVSGGRFVLGLGTGTRGQVAGWHGLDAAHLAPRLEELVPLLRRLWRLRGGRPSPPGRLLSLRPRAPRPGPARRRGRHGGAGERPDAGDVRGLRHAGAGAAAVRRALRGPLRGAAAVRAVPLGGSRAAPGEPDGGRGGVRAGLSASRGPRLDRNV